MSKKPSLLLSLIPVAFLIAILIVNVWIFQDSATSGPNQMALLFCAMIACFLGVFVLKISWEELEKKIIEAISMSMGACLILLVVGSLIGLWILSGVVPTMIYYGLKIIHPDWFLPFACISCAIVSLATGSSWSTAGTLGIALIGIGKTMQIPEGIVVGAIVSGAYFGDKMSPLSDTTNLASAMAGTELFTHVKHMIYSSGPAILLALLLFTGFGFFYRGEGGDPQRISQILTVLDHQFSIGLHVLIIPFLLFFLVSKKVKAFPALITGAILGALGALIFQKTLLISLMGGEFSFFGAYEKILTVAYRGFSLSCEDEFVNKLLSRGGMAGMLNTIWLILMAMVFGGSLEGTGMLQKIAGFILQFVQDTFSLVAATLSTCLMLNLTASDQYLSIVVCGRMYKKAYEDAGLAPQNLSRALEDSGTVTSVLVPWNTCGAYFSTVLGVSTLTYLPWCFFNLLSPVVSLFLAWRGITMTRVPVESPLNSNFDLLKTLDVQTLSPRS